jgi:hypothetical protein
VWRSQQVVNVFLDTQVFDEHAYDFETKHFRQLTAHAEAGLARILLTDITRLGIKAHIAAKAKEAHQALIEVGYDPAKPDLIEIKSVGLEDTDMDCDELVC